MGAASLRNDGKRSLVGDSTPWRGVWTFRGGKTIFGRQRKPLGEVFFLLPILTAETGPQGSLFHNQEVEEGFWVNWGDFNPQQTTDESEMTLQRCNYRFSL